MIYKRKDNSIVFELDGNMCGTVAGDEFWDDIQQRILDGEEVQQYIPPSPDPSYIWDPIEEVWDPPLVDQKIAYRNRVTSERDKRINAGFTYNTKQVACDDVSQNNANAFLTADSLGLVTFPIQWRTIDNTYLSIVDSVELKTFASTMLGFVQGIFQESWTVKDNIENATTIEEVETIYGAYING